MTKLFTHKRADVKVEGGTRARLTNRVQMFQFKDGNPTREAKFLEAGDEVMIQEKRTREAFSKGFKFVYVIGDSGAGYVPKYVINDCILASLKLDGNLTGVSYGGDKWMSDGSENLHVFPYDDRDKKQKCVKCGASANEHKIYESQKASAILVQFVKFLNKQNYVETLSRESGHGVDGMMLGLLETQSSYCFGCSGPNATVPLFRRAVGEFCKNQGLGKYYVADDLKSSDRFLVDQLGDYLSYEQIDKFVPVEQFDMAKLTCAAPKLMQCCYRNGERPVALSEKWVGKETATFQQGMSYKSCDRCRLYIPFMFCSLAK